MDKKEAEFMEKLLNTFKSEAEEHLKAISSGLLTLEKKLPEPEHTQNLEKVFREAHSLKGSARAVNQGDIQDICQTLENVLAAWKKHELTSSIELFDSLYAAVDLLTQVIRTSTKEDRQKKAKDILELTQRLLNLLNQRKQAPAPLPAFLPSVEEKHESAPLTSSTKQNSTQPVIPKENRDKTIRVSISKLDSLLQEVEEMLNLKLSTRQQALNLQDIQTLLEKWKKNRAQFDLSCRLALKAMSESSDPVISNYVKKLNDYSNWERIFIKSFQEHLNHTAKKANQEFRLVDNMVDTLLEDTKKVLMQPFTTILEAFPRMVRDLAHSLQKQVELKCSGEDIEVDKRILEELKDPLIHLIRNSIDHGIESPAERIKKKKSPEGKIDIQISQINGNRIELLFSDDGQGINIQRVKECSIEKGLLTSQEASTTNEQELLKTLFHSGISTKEVVTELSGRGLGLGIIAEKVDRLGGQLTIETHEGLGTTFKLVLPMTLATFRGIQVEVFKRQFIIPTHNVLRVARGNRDAIKNIENKQMIAIEGRILPILHLGSLLGIPEIAEQKKDQEPNPTFPMIIVKATEKTIALEVDKVYGEKDVLVKGLGKLLVHVKNIVAATITEWGEVIPILNPLDLVRSAIDHKEKIFITTAQKAKPTLLLCEDSITSRMLFLNILESSGYSVRAAVDGAEGLSIFENEKIDLILSDIEMPRMDGFTLTERIRSMEKGRHVPIILCSSRESQEDKQHGMKVGANAYLEKSSFTQSNLLNVINKLL